MPKQPKVKPYMSGTRQQPSLQLRVLYLCLLQNGDVGIGIFPEGEQVPIGSVTLGSFARERMGPAKMLFEGQALEGILHLLSDDRALSGGGQSELVRGACWIAPISNITAEGAQA